jgi:hypothetical protein
MGTEKTEAEKPAGVKRPAWLRTALLAVIVCAFALATWLLSQPTPDPLYRGKPLSVWLSQYDTNGLNWPRHANSADEAVRQIGAKGFPLIAKRLQASDSERKIKLIIFLQNLFHSQRIPIPNGVRSRQEGLNALGALQNQAKPLVPVLARAIDRDQVYAEGYAAHWLQSLGPDGEAAIPAIIRKLQATTRTNAVRFLDVFTLARIGVNQTNVVFPVLVTSLRDRDYWVRQSATNTLIRPPWASLGKSILTNLPDVEITDEQQKGDKP